jgi:3-dehydroquinate synthase
MNKITVNLNNGPDRSYSIYVENGLFEKIPAFLKQNHFAENYAVISDSNVAGIYGRKLVHNLNKCGLKTILITFKAGENSKTMKTAEKLLEKMSAKKLGRKCGVIALGGGVTGDLAGFCASVYMRGIALIHVPTSLLAMVDSSIGGKTGVNLTYGKNLVGTFYQPLAVLIDPKVLKTLPKNEFLNGFAEIIKYGVIADEKLFFSLEKSPEKTPSRDSESLRKIIIQCVGIKASITENDEFENGIRMILNYGHTVGHAIERLSKYKISHSMAVAYGMRVANRIALNSGLLNINDLIRINNLLKRYRLYPEIKYLLPKTGKNKSARKLWQIMQSDKKMRKSKINFVLPKTIGKTIICDKVTVQDFIKAFDYESK